MNPDPEMQAVREEMTQDTAKKIAKDNKKDATKKTSNPPSKNKRRKLFDGNLIDRLSEWAYAVWAHLWRDIYSRMFLCFALLLVIGQSLGFILKNQIAGRFILPWSFMTIVTLKQMTLSIILVIIGGYLFYGWKQGGIARRIAQLALYAIGVMLMTSTLALCFFKLWKSADISLAPWETLNLLERLPADSALFRDFAYCLLWSAMVVSIALLAKLFSSQSSASKIFGEAHFSSAFEIQKAGLFSREGIVIGKAFGKTLRLPGFESVLITAPTGSGKTTSIAIPNLIEWSGSVVVNDLKGELYQLTAQYRAQKLENACFVWAPANEDKQTQGYNPFYYVSDNPEFRIRDLQLIAEILIPAERVDGGFWYTSSREILVMLALYLFETKGMATLSQIHDLSKQEHFFEWLKTIVDTEAVEDPVFIQNAHSLLGSDQEKTRKNILKDFHSRMVLFSDPLIRHATNTNDFDFRRLRQQKMSIYLIIPEADKERLRPALTLFWAQLVNAMTKTEPDKNKEPIAVLALLDEFGNMARIDKLKDGMSFLRSYHLRAIVIVQHLSQIMAVYGQHHSKGFLNAKVKVVFAVNDIDDANYFSQALGKKTVKVKSSSHTLGVQESSSKSTSFQSKALLTPDEIMQLKSRKAIILMEAAPPVFSDKCYWFKERRYREVLSDFMKK